MDFERIKKFGVREEVIGIDGVNESDEYNNYNYNLHLHPDEMNYIKKYWKIDINQINEENYKNYVDVDNGSDNSGNIIGRKIIWYYIKHLFSPLKNFRRVRNIFRRLRNN
jgi:hypothetical protein